MSSWYIHLAVVKVQTVKFNDAEFENVDSDKDGDR